MQKLLEAFNIDYLLVNATNKYLVEYSDLRENARYTITGFSGSTGDALITKDNIYLFVDGRYHTQADNEVKNEVSVIKLQIGQSQDEEIKKIIDKNKTLGIVAKKVSQARLESFSEYKVKLINDDPINNYTVSHKSKYDKAFEKKMYSADLPVFITNLDEVSYITGLRDFSQDGTSKIWNKLFIDQNGQHLLNDNDYETFLKEYNGEIYVDKNSINAYDYSLIKNPIHKPSEIKLTKSIKTEEEINAYTEAFQNTDKAMRAIRKFIEENDDLSEFDIATKLKDEFIKNSAKSLSFDSIVAINEHSALAHYKNYDKNTKLNNGDIVLIDCGAYYNSGLATDITRVFVKGKPNELQQEVYTMVLKAFLNCYNSVKNTGYELDKLAHDILDKKVDGFTFSHGLGHGIGINVHEAPPSLNNSEIAKLPFKPNMTFTIEPGLYNPHQFGVRLENSCYKNEYKTVSFVKMGFEGKLINYSMLNEQEIEWLKEFEIL